MSIPRYLMQTDLTRVPAFTPDVLVIGGGIAGLSAALAAAEHCQVMVITKRQRSQSNTFYAQGGIAAALGVGDGPEQHLRDTLTAGAGLCDEAAVRKLVSDGIERVRELLAWGARFDLDADQKPKLTTEGGHSRRRVLHAAGDATGQELQRALLARLDALDTIDVLENCFSVDLLHDDGVVYGALVLNDRGDRLRILAQATVLVTGGAGQLYRETTNPEIATGDGLAMALRAGARLANIEFVQFHPTTLYIAGAPRFLISEAVRGEGALLLAADGTRFMPQQHELAELAPRDVVSVAISREMQRTDAPFVYLDLKPIGAAKVRERFPTILQTCAKFGLDITRDRIPVRPSAHYMMGGIQTTLRGETNVERLFAAGECACTGVHGANRLASNSLLEGLVFGREAGRAAAELALDGPVKFKPRRIGGDDRRSSSAPIDIGDVTRSLKHLLWRAAGVFRDHDSLSQAEDTLRFWRRYVLGAEFTDPRDLELQNMIFIAGLLLRAALLRTESRGAHRRSDFPDTDDANWQQPIVQSIEDAEDD